MVRGTRQRKNRQDRTDAAVPSLTFLKSQTTRRHPSRRIPPSCVAPSAGYATHESGMRRVGGGAEGPRARTGGGGGAGRLGGGQDAVWSWVRAAKGRG